MIRYTSLLCIPLLAACSVLTPRSTVVRDLSSRIQTQFDQLEGFIRERDKLEESISTWSRYKQIEHILLVDQAILTAIENQQEPEEIQSRSLMGYFALGLGYIPRGRAKSPKAVVPEGIEQAALTTLLASIRERYRQLDRDLLAESETVVANHPYFGGLNSREWLRFLEVHTKHHLKIIEDISQSGR